MRAIRRLIEAALFVAVWYFGWIFAAENSSLLSINFLAVQVDDVPLWAALISAFAGGAVAVGAFMLLSMTRTRLVARRYRKMVQGLEGELHQLRNLPLSTSRASISRGEGHGAELDFDVLEDVSEDASKHARAAASDRSLERGA